MIALDTTVLVYAKRAELPRHREALRLLRQPSEGEAPWSVPWPCVYEYLRIVTHPKFLRPASDLVQTRDELDALSESPSLAVPGAGPGHRAHLRSRLEAGRATGNIVHDGHETRKTYRIRTPARRA